MARILRMPEVTANAIEAILQGWSVSESTPFSVGDTIATVETEKAVVDVEAEADGVIMKTLVPEGAAVEVGAPIAIIGEVEEKVDDLDALLAQLGVPAPTGPVVAAKGPDVSDTAETVPVISEASIVPATNGCGTRDRIFASPLARRLAKEASLLVDQIIGTGPGGRILRRDVETATSQRAALAGAQQLAVSVELATLVDSSSTVSTAITAPASAGNAYADSPHSKMRRAIAVRLTQSKQATPHFYLRGTCRVDKLLKLRQELNAGGPVKISINDLVIKVAARAQVLVPAVNVIWTQDAIRSFSSVDMSIAIATERGLVTPVLRSVERMSISTVAAQVQDFAARAKSGRLLQEEIEGGALSITNLGMFGTEEFAAILNPPQAAILAVGAVKQEPIVKNGKLKVGRVMRVTLSVDHRPIDGTLAAEWMRTFVSIVENPLQILT